MFHCLLMSSLLPVAMAKVLSTLESAASMYTWEKEKKSMMIIPQISLDLLFSAIFLSRCPLCGNKVNSIKNRQESLQFHHKKMFMPYTQQMPGVENQWAIPLEHHNYFSSSKGQERGLQWTQQIDQNRFDSLEFLLAFWRLTVFSWKPATNGRWEEVGTCRHGVGGGQGVNAHT